MIKSFECENFRNVSCNELDLARINILIGPNNAGKSNFIRALSFAANMMRPHPNETSGFLSELKRNGWNAVINRQANDKHSFKLVWKFKLKEKRPVVYTLKVHTGNREKCYGRLIRRSWSVIVMFIFGKDFWRYII